MERHEAGSSSRCQAILLLVQKPEVHHRVNKSQLLLSDMSHKRSQFLQRTFCKILHVHKAPNWVPSLQVERPETFLHL
jgi:hypothetical protein